jgi:uncharacterized membrane protein
VVFAMLGNHYAIAHASDYSWLVLAVFLAAGALIRQFFVLWHSGQRAWWLLGAGGVALLAAFAWLAPRPQPLPPPPVVAPAPTPSPDKIEDILGRRCSACHSAKPTLVASAPKGAMFDTAEQIQARAPLIYLQVVQTRAMPPGNLTQMTDEERAAVARWYESSTSESP